MSKCVAADVLIKLCTEGVHSLGFKGYIKVIFNRDITRISKSALERLKKLQELMKGLMKN